MRRATLPHNRCSLSVQHLFRVSIPSFRLNPQFFFYSLSLSPFLSLSAKESERPFRPNSPGHGLLGCSRQGAPSFLLCKHKNKNITGGGNKIRVQGSGFRV
jgi:hypothetical protein